jgi:tetratricopeptide (TPR) repeat protein
MPRTPAHKWAFKPGMRAGLYSWRSSSKAVERLKSATSEIKVVNRSDPVTAAEGVVALAERIWPAFEHIDTSTGALGSAVYRTLTELLPVLIAAPAPEPVRAKWLERLRTAIEEDGVQYLQPISDRFGEIAVYRNLQNTHADRDLDIIRAVWADHASFGFMATATLTLSCLLEAGRYKELIELVGLQKSRFWSDDRFVAEALLRQGREEDALAHAESLLRKEQRPWGFNDISRFCEAILVQQGREEEAYRRFGLPSASGNTYLAMWRDLVKRYPDLDARRILEDLIETHGSKGKWFAAAKTARFLDIALECAAHYDAAPATLIRAARDLKLKEPAFAMQVALQAIRHLVEGRGYEPSPLDIDEAVEHLMVAATRIEEAEQARQALRQIAGSALSAGIMAERLARNIAALEAVGRDG